MAVMSVASRKRTGDRPTFEGVARTVMREVQESLARQIAGIPTPPVITKAADLQKALKVDPKLGWRIYRVAHAENPLAAGAEVPSAVSMRRLFKAADKVGVPSKEIARASEAFEAFERLVVDHAGDRDSFLSMVTSLVGDEVSPVDLQHRKAAFTANSHLLGVQAKTRLSCQIFWPDDASGLVRFAALRGFVDLRWLRGDDVPVVLASELVHEQTHAKGDRALTFRPIDPEAHKRYSGSLLAEYCSQPIEGIETFEEPDGSVDTVLRSREVGNTSSRTYIVGSLCTSLINPYRELKPTNDIGVVVRIPCLTMIHDVMIHESFVVGEPSVRSYSDHDGGKSAFRDVRVPLMQRMAVSYLGNGADVLHTRDMPHYVEMVEDVAERLGIDPEPLRVYRCRVEYPFMPSSVVMCFDAPEKPGG